MRVIYTTAFGLEASPYRLVRTLPARIPPVAHPKGVQQHPRRVVCGAQADSELPPGLKKIVGAFQMVPDPMARYKQLLFFASKLEALDANLKVEENKVKGCVSQVWVVPQFTDGRMYWCADSDAALTKGLAALLVKGLSGCTPEEVTAVEPDFIEALGLKQSLTPSRNNGFLNMFRQMQKQAAEHAAFENGASRSESSSSRSDGANGEAATNGDRRVASKNLSESDGLSALGHVGSPWEPSPDRPKPVAASMDAKLRAGLRPAVLEIVDESGRHSGHAGAKGVQSPSGETHFWVKVVSEKFDGLNTLKRHRLVFELLAEELAGPVHALSLETKSPSDL